MARTVAIRFAILVLASIALAAAVHGCGDDDNPTAPGGGGGGGSADVTINIGTGVAQADTNAYSPRRVTVAMGQSVSWKNNDNMAHTATAGATFNTGNIGPGATSTPIPMNTAGTFTYICTIAGHQMTGFLTVTP